MRRFLVLYTIIIALLFGAFSAFQQHQAQAGFKTLMGVGTPQVISSNCNPPLLSCVTVPSGLSFWAPLDTSTTSGATTNDLSGNSLNGTLVGSPSIVTGQIQQGVSLNGSSQYVTIPTSGLLPGIPGSFSLTAWINASSSADGEIMDDDEPAVECIELRQSRSGSGVFNFVIGNANLGSSTTVASRVGSWTFIVATFDGTSAEKIYINGALDNSATVSPAGGCGTSQWVIGNDLANSGPFFPGKIDDVRMYKSVTLSGANITSIYNAGIAGNP